MSLVKQSKFKSIVSGVNLASQLTSLILLVFFCSSSQSANFSLALERLSDQQAMQLIAPYLQQRPKPPVIIAKYGYIHFSGSRAQYKNFVRYWQQLQSAPMYLVEILSNKKPKQMLGLQPSPRNKSTRALGPSYSAASQKLIGPLGQALKFKLNRRHQLKQLWLAYSPLATADRAPSRFSAAARAPLIKIEPNEQIGEILLLPGSDGASLNLSFRLQPNLNTLEHTNGTEYQADIPIHLGRWYNLGKPKPRQTNRATVKRTSTTKLGFGSIPGLKRLYIRVHRIKT